MDTSCHIAVDTLGSETETSEIVRGALEFASSRKDCYLTFIGRDQDLSRVCDLGHQVVICDEFIGQHEPLTSVLRKGRDTTMKHGLDLLRTHQLNGLVSTGNTGALMALSRHLVPMLPGIDRPAIIKRFSGKQQSFWMLDLGANISCKPSLLVQFAHIGCAYARALEHISNPRISLLNIGSEAYKGPQALRETAHLLSIDQRLNFIGFTEADRIFDGDTDVIVTDGFSGNIALKSIEGTAEIARHIIRKELTEADLIEDETANSVARNVVDSLDSQAYNGASLIGLDGVVVKSHGRTDRVGISAALALAHDEIEANVPKQLRDHIAMEDAIEP